MIAYLELPEFASNELCLFKTSTRVFSVYLVYMKPFSPAENVIVYTSGFYVVYMGKVSAKLHFK